MFVYFKRCVCDGVAADYTAWVGGECADEGEQTTHDPAVYVVSACGFVLSSAIVTLVAARRAASVDPLVALRQ